MASALWGGIGAGPRALFRRRGFCRCFGVNQTKCRLWESHFLGYLFDSARCWAVEPVGLTYGVVREAHCDWGFFCSIYFFDTFS